MTIHLLLVAGLIFGVLAIMSYAEGWTVPGTGGEEVYNFSCQPPPIGCDV